MPWRHSYIRCRLSVCLAGCLAGSMVELIISSCFMLLLFLSFTFSRLELDRMRRIGVIRSFKSRSRLLIQSFSPSHFISSRMWLAVRYAIWHVRLLIRLQCLILLDSAGLGWAWRQINGIVISALLGDMKWLPSWTVSWKTEGEAIKSDE